MTREDYAILLNVADDLKSLEYVMSMLEDDGLSITQDGVIKGLHRLVNAGLVEVYRIDEDIPVDPASPVAGYVTARLGGEVEYGELWFYRTQRGVEEIRSRRREGREPFVPE